LMEEIVTEILARLPVKPLLRFRSVCKAWRAIISDPVFIRAHLRCPASNWERSPRFVISPHTLDEDFGGEFNSLRYFSHCDGLVFAPTDTRLYVFNSATREAITLPDGYRNFLRVGGRGCCYCGGLGLDPRTGKYKAVQGFYRSWEPDTNLRTVMGMEVLTIAGEDGEDWREIRNDPPYPWCPEPPRGILHLSLGEEEFGITKLPDSLDPSLDDDFILDVLYGRDLALMNSLWQRRYSIELSSSFPCHTMSLPPFSNGIILWETDTVYCYDPATSKLTTICELDRMRYQRVRKWKNLFGFNVRPFTESLVRITSS
ncbi:hypothetical protein SETIT_1G228600v2, partial [Setaria italica]